jgi:hypothetical protein
MQKFRDPVRSFFNKISMGAGCWEWQAQRDRKGYGRLSVGGRKVFAHRFAYELFVGPAGNLLVCHRCDNPRCVRPDHLFVGTHAENMADMRAKGRPGPRRPSPTLCRAGHDDWVIRHPKNRKFSRECRTCARERKRRSYAKLHGKSDAVRALIEQ